MKIELSIGGTKYGVNVEGNCFAAIKYDKVQDEKSKNYGAEKEIQLGYFTNLPKALLKCQQEQMATIEETVTLRGFIDRYEALKNELMQQFKGVKF